MGTDSPVIIVNSGAFVLIVLATLVGTTVACGVVTVGRCCVPAIGRIVATSDVAAGCT